MLPQVEEGITSLELFPDLHRLWHIHPSHTMHMCILHFKERDYDDPRKNLVCKQIHIKEKKYYTDDWGFVPRGHGETSAGRCPLNYILEAILGVKH